MSKEPDNALNQCLRSVWQRSQQKHIAGGLLAFARWFVPLFLLVVVIDRFIDLPDWLREDLRFFSWLFFANLGV